MSNMGTWMEFTQEDEIVGSIMIRLDRVMAFYPDGLSKTWVTLSGDACALFKLKISYYKFKELFENYIIGGDAR